MTEEQLEAAAKDVAFVRHYEKVMLLYDQRVKSNDAWFPNNYRRYAKSRSLPTSLLSLGCTVLCQSTLVVWAFSPETMLKKPATWALPFVGVGFLYPQGYFRQQIPSHGWQEAVYKQLDTNLAPVAPVYLDDDKELHISVFLGDRNVYARVWHVHVGRISLYLLDTDVDENDPWDRELSARLYTQATAKCVSAKKFC